MLVSKSALQVVGLTVADKQIPVLDTVRIEADGTVVGSNREVVLCVSPVKAEVEAKLPLKSKGDTAVTLSSDTVRDAIKYIGVDKKFEGLLEHCDVSVADGNAVLTMYDGKRTKALQAKPYPKDYYDYKDLLRTVNAKGIKARVLLNRKRLTLMLETLNRVCQDGSDFAFLFAEFTNDGDMVVKSINRKTGQRVLGVVRGVPVKSVDTQWLASDPWQDRLLPPALPSLPAVSVISTPTKDPTMAVKRISRPATVVPTVV